MKQSTVLSAGGGPAGGGHTRKHSRTRGGKHKQSARKHTPPVTPPPLTGGGGPVHVVAKPPKQRQLSPGWDVACCSAQAVGTLLGWDHNRVLDLYWRTARDPDAGGTIAATIAAAELDYLPGMILGVSLPEPHAVAVTPDGTWWSWGEPFDPDDWPHLVVEEVFR